jgi:hypothetical protein
MTKKRSFKTKTFSRWMKKTGLKDANLLQAINEMEDGLIDADLGGYVYKKRVALRGTGKRSGARTLVASNCLKRWIFMYGFSKGEQTNIDRDELVYLQETAKRLLNLNEDELKTTVALGELLELNDYGN